MALAPKTPRAAKVRRSAWTPAPPPKSDRRSSARSGCGPSCPSRCGDPFPRADLRIGVQRDVGDDRNDAAPAARQSLARSTLSPPMATSGGRRRYGASIRRCRRALRGEGHRLEDRRIDRSERDIVGLEPQRAVQLRLVMRRHPKLEAGLADGPNVRAVEVALAQVDPVRALVDRDPPMVVDDQRRASPPANLQRLPRIPRNRRLVPVLDPELDELAPTPTSRATQSALSTIG